MGAGIRRVSTDRAGRTKVPSTQAVVVGNLVFVAGTGALEPGTHEIRARNFTEQVERTIENIRVILEEAGTSLEHCVKVQAVVRNLSDFDEFNRVYREHFQEPYPPRMTTVSDLVREDAHVEMSVIAVLPDSDADVSADRS